MTDEAPASGERIAQAYLDACLAELWALKPGNVHIHADGHRMTVDEFETSARVTAPVMGEPALKVGARIHEAVRRTRDAVGVNTNLGIVLLCAPLAAAEHAIDPGPGEARIDRATRERGLRDALQSMLAGLGVDDAEEAFSAIRLASPAGLGEVSKHDVRNLATVTLLKAMRAARSRDRIAEQYATRYRDVFEVGVTRIEQGLARWKDPHWAATLAYLGFLTTFPDSHIARKHGEAVAANVQREATLLDRELLDTEDPARARGSLLEFDAELKSRQLNPGTSADLTVASLFVVGLLESTARS
jgi:triphosphoribosyl-dephospho-CoA synthase